MPLGYPNRAPDASWLPAREGFDSLRIVQFSAAMEKRWGRRIADYDALHQWSIEHLDEFWSGVWEFCDVLAAQRGARVLAGESMEHASWFPESRLNYAENLLRKLRGEEVLVFWNERGFVRRMTAAELYSTVAQLAAALRNLGIGRGDRVAAYMPNMPETLIAMLAASSIGAIFSSASPDFGVEAVLDRFGQIEPAVLFAADGYLYNGKTHRCLPRIAELERRLRGLRKIVVCPYLEKEIALDEAGKAVTLAQFTEPFEGTGEIEFAQLPFDAPLYIVYSSGTTGAPKCIVHRAGGALMKHLVEHQLHGEVTRGSRLFYYTTCGWVMWNWLMSGLASGATLMLYDGSPFAREGRILFDYMERERFTHFGTSARFLEACAKRGLTPKRTHDLTALRTIFSTGSPLAPESFDYVYSAFREDVHLASICGGTDLLGAFIGGNPAAPVWRGEIQCAELGMAVDVYDEQGRPTRGRKGELVCTRPFPSQPLGFWNDPDGRRYHESYFSRYRDVWCHGDYCEITAHGGFVVYGRSDATLNPGGVRIGTAEIYRQVAKIPEVVESAAVAQRWPPDKPSDVRVVLFVTLREGIGLTPELQERIKRMIRENASPRHVPSCIVQVPELPRTRSGKTAEIAIRQVIHGETVTNIQALENPESLGFFRDRAELAG